MTDIRIEPEGLEELTDLLKNLAPRNANNVMRNAVVDLARDQRDEVKRRAPKDEGTLERAIKAVRRRGKKDQLEASVVITHGRGQRFDAYYWHFVEFGTTKRRAHPFITPATEAFRPQVPERLREHFGKRFEREMQRLAKRNSK